MLAANSENWVCHAPPLKRSERGFDDRSNKRLLQGEISNDDLATHSNYYRGSEEPNAREADRPEANIAR
jgi:hypothetical protein